MCYYIKWYSHNKNNHEQYGHHDTSPMPKKETCEKIILNIVKYYLIIVIRSYHRN